MPSFFVSSAWLKVFQIDFLWSEWSLPSPSGPAVMVVASSAWIYCFPKDHFWSLFKREQCQCRQWHIKPMWHSFTAYVWLFLEINLHSPFGEEQGMKLGSVGGWVRYENRADIPGRRWINLHHHHPPPEWSDIIQEMKKWIKRKREALK